MSDNSRIEWTDDPELTALAESLADTFDSTLPERDIRTPGWTGET